MRRGLTIRTAQRPRDTILRSRRQLAASEVVVFVDVNGGRLEIDIDDGTASAVADRAPALVTTAMDAVQGAHRATAEKYAAFLLREVDFWSELGMSRPSAAGDLLKALRPLSLWGSEDEGYTLDLGVHHDVEHRLAVRFDEDGGVNGVES